MKRMIATGLAAGFAMAVMGCSQPADSGSQATASPMTHENHEGHDHGAATPTAGKVAVDAKGTKFDPPVPVDQMPTGAWACVMSEKVHFASMEEGDGKCDVCKMKLLKQGAKS